MSQALIGLVGVVVGAVLSGGVGYLVARRDERRRARASARLLQAELRPVADYLDAVVVGNLELFTGAGRPLLASALGPLLEMTPPRLWAEHQALLAWALGTADWYAIASAYERVDQLRSVAETEGAPDTRDAYSGDVVELVSVAIDEVRRGVAALSRLAGGTPSPPASDPFFELARRRAALPEPAGAPPRQENTTGESPG